MVVHFTKMWYLRYLEDTIRKIIELTQFDRAMQITRQNNFHIVD